MQGNPYVTWRFQKEQRRFILVISESYGTEASVRQTISSPADTEGNLLCSRTKI